MIASHTGHYLWCIIRPALDYFITLGSAASSCDFMVNKSLYMVLVQTCSRHWTLGRTLAVVTGQVWDMLEIVLIEESAVQTKLIVLLGTLFFFLVFDCYNLILFCFRYWGEM